MSVITYNYSTDKNKKLSDHFSVGEFASPSDYNGNYPEQILIDSSLIVLLEDVIAHFNCDRCDINSGYRTAILPSAARATVRIHTAVQPTLISIKTVSRLNRV